jgi:hypothetical protein
MVEHARKLPNGATDMFANEFTADGEQPICPVCNVAMVADQGATSGLVQTPTGLWFIHNRCVALQNVAALMHRIKACIQQGDIVRAKEEHDKLDAVMSEYGITATEAWEVA